MPHYRIAFLASMATVALFLSDTPAVGLPTWFKAIRGDHAVLPLNRIKDTGRPSGGTAQGQINQSLALVGAPIRQSDFTGDSQITAK